MKNSVDQGIFKRAHLIQTFDRRALIVLNDEWLYDPKSTTEVALASVTTCIRYVYASDGRMIAKRKHLTGSLLPIIPRKLRA